MTPILPASISHLPTVNSAKVQRILVVDDESAILFAYRKLIEKDGLAVDISSTLEDAIHQIRSRHYLAVIADMRLAGTDNADGLEILRFVQNEHPETKTILATGYGNSEIETTARSLGAAYCFKKPVQPVELLAALKALSAGTVFPSVKLPS